jgi:hypothetical protein
VSTAPTFEQRMGPAQGNGPPRSHRHAFVARQPDSGCQLCRLVERDHARAHQTPLGLSLALGAYPGWVLGSRVLASDPLKIAAGIAAERALELKA